MTLGPARSRHIPPWLRAVWAWYRNVLAAGGAELDFGRGPRPAAYRILPAEEAVWRMVQELPMLAFRPRHADDTPGGLGNSAV